MDSAKLTPLTSSFALAAAITSLVNTVLACAKDANAPLRALMKSVAGHDWTTQGLFDLAVFAALGFIFMKSGVAEKMDPGSLTGMVIGAVAISATTLVLWFAFF